MQFVPKGPDIPSSLLNAHEEGQVVFFCGAGISMAAGLPDFGGLVDRLYVELGTTPDNHENERNSYTSKHYDMTLELLERRFPGKRSAVRRMLFNVLKPDRSLSGALQTHEALCKLARSSDGRMRLVTTNFDRLFEIYLHDSGSLHERYLAPTLPIPKGHRWNGLVYLHGLLPEIEKEDDLNRLVLTSGDFGLAYLVERWASRFVSELFRNYVVCFVGYSVGDPVMRYMMDALAADKMLGGSPRAVFAFGKCKPGETKTISAEWSAKGVEPVLYEIPEGTGDHSLLSSTLKKWADTYRDGVSGKERIVSDCAAVHPSKSTQEDDFIGRMLWAVSDPSGIPAALFCNHFPVPSLDWLRLFAEERFGTGDLRRFGINPIEEDSEQIRYSLLRRPAPHSRAPWMSMVSNGTDHGKWDKVTDQIANWLLKHLNDPELMLWILEQGGCLHPNLSNKIVMYLDWLEKLEKHDPMKQLEQHSNCCPNAIPHSQMRILWRLVLAGRIKHGRLNTDFYQWMTRLKTNGLTLALKYELRGLLAPKIMLQRQYGFLSHSSAANESDTLRRAIRWEIALEADYSDVGFNELDDETRKLVLPALFGEFQQLLLDALDLAREMGDADDRMDHSYHDLPSIKDHWQNRGFHNWVYLITLIRDAWLIIYNNDLPRSTDVARSWYETPYPTFKRLALFAASNDKCINPEEWVGWLLADDAWWLWSPGVQREVMRLLVLQGGRLSGVSQSRLEEAIVKGPPRYMYRSNLEPEEFESIVNRAIWLLLEKLRSSGLLLGPEALSKLADLQRANPDWALSSDEREEFNVWTSGTGDPGFEDERVIEVAPDNYGELLAWLEKPGTGRWPFRSDNWAAKCKSDMESAGSALLELARKGVWPDQRWEVALHVWSDNEEICHKSWNHLSQSLLNLSDRQLLSSIHPLTWWLAKVSESVGKNDGAIIKLSQRILSLPVDPYSMYNQDRTPVDQPVHHAINHPIGHVTQALLNLWYKHDPQDGLLLPAEIKKVFSDICVKNDVRFQHGKVLLASNLVSLYRADPEWTERYLAPLLDWKTRPDDARSVWPGALWSFRLHQPLMKLIKVSFLETANHYDQLSEHRSQYARALTHVALNHIDGYTDGEIQLAVAALPIEGLYEVAATLAVSLEGAGERREQYWRNRILPLWHKMWPKDASRNSKEISLQLALLCIYAGNEFPSARKQFQYWLDKIGNVGFIVRRFNESGLATKYPLESLAYLDALYRNKEQWADKALGECLNAIASAEPNLKEDRRFIDLNKYFKMKRII